MNYSKKILLIFLLSIFCQNIFSQSRHGYYGLMFPHSITFAGGGDYYFGDLEKDGLFSKAAQDRINYYGEVSYKRDWHRNFKLRGSLVYAKLSGKRSNYGFTSNLVEPDFILEIYPFSSRKFSKKCNCDMRIAKFAGIYGFIGVGLSLNFVDFEDLENGDKRNFTSATPMAVFGGGYAIPITDQFYVGVEFGYRIALLDTPSKNLDGYPFYRQGNVIRGIESKWLDGYYTFGLTLAYHWGY